MSTVSTVAGVRPQMGAGRALVWVLPVLAISAALLPSGWIALGIGAILGIILLLYLADAMLRGRLDALLLFWVAFFPLGYYFLSWPREHPLISFDRVMVLVIVVAAALAAPGPGFTLPDEMKWPALAWGAFLLAAAISLVHLQNPLGGSKLLVDVFLLPALLGYCVLRDFHARRYLPLLHSLVCSIAIYSTGVGIAEFVLNRDLLPLPASIFYKVGESQTLVPRVNGPFSTNNSFGLIGLISLVFLLFLRSQLPEKLPFGRRLLHWLGVTASFLMASMPLFRSIFITLLLIVLIDFFYSKSLGARVLRLTVLAIAASLALAAQALAPEVYEDRTNPENLYQRIAQQKQTLEIFLSHPITGIGIGNFLVFASHFQTAASFEDVNPANAAHNNLGEVIAETGLLGGIPYAVAQVLFLAAFWKLNKRGTESAKRCWKCFLYIFLSYWVNGMALSAGYYQDLNLWYILATTVLYKSAITCDSALAPTLSTTEPNDLSPAHP